MNEIQKLIELALKEDIGAGDITSDALIHKNLLGKAEIVAKTKGVLAGIKIAEKVFKKKDPNLFFIPLKKDGENFKPNDKIAIIEGRVKSILKCERTALNFLQKLSGIATLTQSFVSKMKGEKIKILDTRKTTPGFRILEKYAVKVGGGENHRMGLYDMILIKENHIKAAGDISSAIQKAKKTLENKDFVKKFSKKKKIKIEVETKNLNEVKNALGFKIDMIMLDNMPIQMIKKASQIIRKSKKNIKIEVSGNIDLKNLRDYSKLDIDYISIGAITHSSKAIDLSLNLIEIR